MDPERHRLAAIRRISMFSGGLTTELRVPDETFLWLAVGVFRPMKAFDRPVRTFSRMPEGVHLVLAGDGPQRENIAGMIEELGRRRTITLLGLRDDSATGARIVSIARHMTRSQAMRPS